MVEVFLLFQGAIVSCGWARLVVVVLTRAQLIPEFNARNRRIGQ